MMHQVPFLPAKLHIFLGSNPFFLVATVEFFRPFLRLQLQGFALADRRVLFGPGVDCSMAEEVQHRWRVELSGGLHWLFQWGRILNDFDQVKLQKNGDFQGQEWCYINFFIETECPIKKVNQTLRCINVGCDWVLSDFGRGRRQPNLCPGRELKLEQNPCPFYCRTSPSL